MVIGFLPRIGGLCMLLGVLLVLIALKGYADTYKEHSIFNNAIYTIVFELIGAVFCIVILIYVAVGFATSLGITNLADATSWEQIDWQNAVNFEAIKPFIVPVVLAVVVLFAFTVFAAFYFKKSMNTLSEKTGESLFHTTGTVFFIGAILTIILIGFLVIWISFLLLMISFYKTKPLEQTQQPQQQTPPLQP